MDLSSMIDDIWPSFDTQNKGYLDKSECQDLLESTVKHIPQVNFDFAEYKDKLLQENKLPLSGGPAMSINPFDQFLFDKLFNQV